MKCKVKGLGTAFALCAALLIQSASSQPTAGAVEGHWGGERLRLVVDAGGARIALDCAKGGITGPLKLDSGGAFSAVGTFEQQRPGPQSADDLHRAVQARYAGQVSDGQMTLSILPEGAAAARVFHLRRDAAVKLVRCL